MTDIDKFSEAKMTSMYFICFKRSIEPEELRSKFIESFKGIQLTTDDVVHGYKGPDRLRIPGSTCSETEEEFYGVQRIGFWYGVSKTMNYLPLFGTIGWAARKLDESINAKNDWRYIYFDGATGQMIGENEAMNIQKKNKEADLNYKQGEKFIESGNFKDAYEEFKKAFDNCSVGYKNQSTFKKAMDDAFDKKINQIYVEADNLALDLKFDEALHFYKEADKLIKDPNQKRQSFEKQAVILKQMADQLIETGSLDIALKKCTEALKMTNNDQTKNKVHYSISLIYAKEGEKLFNDGKFKEASEKFEQASIKTTESTYDKWLKRIRTELEVTETEEEGDFYLNDKKYEQAISQYRLALKKTQIQERKNLIRNKMKEAEEKLENSQDLRIHAEQLNRLKAFDLVIKGYELLCDGKKLKSDGKSESAGFTYDLAGKILEQAAKIEPSIRVFNGILRLIEAQCKMQDYDAAIKMIETSKHIFEGKANVLKEIEDKIIGGSFSIDYLSRLLEGEKEKAENDKKYSCNLFVPQ